MNVSICADIDTEDNCSQDMHACMHSYDHNQVESFAYCLMTNAKETLRMSYIGIYVQLGYHTLLH